MSGHSPFSLIFVSEKKLRSREFFEVVCVCLRSAKANSGTAGLFVVSDDLT
jgi:hypothetical protein